MKRRTARDTWAANLLLAAGLFASVGFPHAAEEAAPGVPASDLGGRVFGTGGRPAEGVQILAYHLATAETFTAVSNQDGEFTLLRLPYGYFDMAARPTDGLYVADQVAQVSELGNNFVEFRLQALNAAARADLRTFAGAGEAPIGIAVMSDQRLVEPSFWTRRKGIGTLAGGGAALLVLLTGGGSDPPASPYIP